MKAYFVIAFLNALLWSALAAMTFGSLFLDASGWLPSVMIGTVFIGASVFFYLKARWFQRFLAAQDSWQKLNRFLYRYLVLDMIFALLSGLFAIILNAAAISRVFGERLPLFG